MDNQEMFTSLKKILVDGLAQTENRILNEVVSVKTDLNQFRTETNQHFDALEQELKQLHYSGITEVANEMLDDKQQMQHEIDFLKRRIHHLEKKISNI